MAQVVFYTNDGVNTRAYGVLQVDAAIVALRAHRTAMLDVLEAHDPEAYAEYFQARQVLADVEALAENLAGRGRR